MVAAELLEGEFTGLGGDLSQPVKGSLCLLEELLGQGGSQGRRDAAEEFVVVTGAKEEFFAREIEKRGDLLESR